MEIHVLNTDASHGAIGAEAEWLRRGLAVTSGDQTYERKLRRVAVGDWVLVWANKKGIVAAGQATDDLVRRVTGVDLVNPDEPWEFHRGVQWRLDLRDSPIAYTEFVALSGVRPSGAGKRIRDSARKAAVLSRLAELEDLCTSDPVEYAEAADNLLDRGAVVRPAGHAAPKRVEGMSNVFYRSPWVRAWSIQRAGCTCELCEGNAPFLRQSGRPYLESHHVVPLSEGGGDTPENTAAVCPNCHRELHHGRDRTTKREKLRSIVSRKEAQYLR